MPNIGIFLGLPRDNERNNVNYKAIFESSSVQRFSVSSVAYSSFIGKQGDPKTKPLPFSDDDAPMSQSITTTERWVEGGMV